ncbi:serine/threonine-protein phosphatase 7 long form homolog [Camellia sinensis]|uniref:serine/threonine-protein phosphatase 7 long form homolog n=1 Tax=Camellia sinensis TaxID=4442 RepID=UPI001035D62B|nr:serine/threonine-protein phosphatase 7 long form homolog [Camellia sinensis]
MGGPGPVTHPDQSRTVVACRRGDSGLWDRPLDHRVLQCLLRAGFYGVYRIGHIRLDHPLITALVERWRTETHTFHFPTGEATVTLQDVSVLYGLRIDGRAVTGLDPSLTTEQWIALCAELLGVAPTPADLQAVTGLDLSLTREQWIALCAELLGVAPTPADLQAGRVRVRWLSEHFQGDFPDDAADELVQQHARAYILWLIGGVLLLDKSQNLLKLMYLPLLRDIDVIGQYSWGAAALACLYRMLCRATQVGVTQIGGPLVLLQIWAWERLIRIAPSRQQLVGPGEVPIGQGDMQMPAGPRGSWWRVDMSHEVVSIHVVVVYRDQLDRMIDGEFIWQPYADVLHTLPDYCRLGEDIWMARVPLICYDVVEWHLPDRVLRQFGRVQAVPDRCDTEWRLHATDRRGQASTDWSLHHMRYIQLWDARRDTIVQADWSDRVLPSPDPYMLWYRRHTHLLVGNPSHLSEAEYQGVGPSLEALVVRAGRSYHLAEDAIFRRDGQLGLQALAEIRELLYEGIQHAHRVDRLHFGDYGVHSAAAAPDTSVPSTSVPPSSAPATAGPSTSVTPPHDTPYISPYSPHVHLTQHTDPDPDWSPPRFMHDVIAPPTQLQPTFLGSTSTAPRFMHDVVTPPTQLSPAFMGTTSTAPRSTHDAVLTDISHIDDEAHIEPPQSARERLWSWGTSRPRSGCGQRQRSRSSCRS